MTSCRQQSSISAALDEGRELPTPLQRHIEGCTACSQFVQAARQLDKRLSTQPKAKPAPWLHTRIMAGVQAAEPATPRNWLPAFAGVAAIAIALAVITTTIQQPDPKTIAATTESLPSPITPVHPVDLTRDIEQHAKLALGNEFQNIATDISGARDFLTASFRRTIPGFGAE